MLSFEELQRATSASGGVTVTNSSLGARIIET